MADSTAFVVLCEALENESTLDRLEARGTIRLALRQAGLDARSVTAAQLTVVVEKILPTELETRGVESDVCPRLVSSLANLTETASPNDSPEGVFSRLGA